MVPERQNIMKTRNNNNKQQKMAMDAEKRAEKIMEQMEATLRNAYLQVAGLAQSVDSDDPEVNEILNRVDLMANTLFAACLDVRKGK